MSPFVFMASEIVSGNHSDSATSSAKSTASVASSRCPSKNWIRPSCAASIATSASGSSSFRVSNAGCIRASASSSIDRSHIASPIRADTRAAACVSPAAVKRSAASCRSAIASSVIPLMSAMKPASSFSDGSLGVRIGELGCAQVIAAGGPRRGE